MFSAISESITKKLEEAHAIKSEDREIYLYGVKQGLTILLNLITICAIGIVSKMLWQSILFMAAYIPLRSFAGGYHAKTPLRCYIYSIIMLILVSVGMKYLLFVDMVYYVILAISALIIFVLSPVEDKNKPLDKIEIKVYRKRLLLIMLIELIICVVFKALDINKLFISIVYALFVMSIVLLIGIIKNKIMKITP